MAQVLNKEPTYPWSSQSPPFITIKKLDGLSKDDPFLCLHVENYLHFQDELM